MLTILFLMISGNSLWKWIRGLGGPGLVLLGIADNAPFFSAPAGSVDVLVILLASQSRELWGYYALMAIVGEVVGGYLTYRFAEKTGEKALEKKFGKQRATQVYRWFEKRGTGLVVMVGAMLPPPFPFTPVLTAAGIMHYPKNKFLPSLFVGRSVRFFVMAYLGRAYGQQVISFFSRYYRPALYVLIALAIVSAIAALVYFKWYKPRAQHHDGDQD
jgi:membrane protein YqaA with SNARE-associated domain